MNLNCLEVFLVVVESLLLLIYGFLLPGLRLCLGTLDLCVIVLPIGREDA